MKRVAIVGGGISGLAAAYTLEESSHAQALLWNMSSTKPRRGWAAYSAPSAWMVASSRPAPIPS